MALRFRKSFAIIPGIRLNIGKKSASLRIGGKGFGFTTGTAGHTVSASLPGTGLGLVHKIKSRPSRSRAAPAHAAIPSPRRPWRALLVIYAIVFLIWRAVLAHWGVI